MKFVEKLLLFGFVLVGAAGCYAGMTLDQERTGKVLANKYQDINVASLPKLAKKIELIDWQNNLVVTKESLKGLFNDKAEREAETKEFLAGIPKGKLPKARVADFPRAINIVQNIGELKDGDRNLLKARLVDIESVVHALTVSPSWEKIATILNPNKQYPTFSVPSQTTPKAMFSGVNAISKAAENFLTKLAAVVTAKAKINKDATALVKVLDDRKTIYTSNLKNLQLSIELSTSPLVESLITTLKTLGEKNAALETINKALKSINLAKNWVNLGKAIENKIDKNAKFGIIPIVKSWDNFCAALSIKVRLGILAENIKKIFSKFGKNPTSSKKFTEELDGYKKAIMALSSDKDIGNANKDKLKELANKLTSLIDSDGNIKNIPGWIGHPIKPIIYYDKVIDEDINGIVEAFNESVKKLPKKMENWK